MTSNPGAPRDRYGFRIEEDWHQPSDSEREMLTRLFTKYPPAGVDWARALSETRIRRTTCDDSDYRSIDFEIAEHNMTQGDGVAVDLESRDVDNVPIMLLCFVRGDGLGNIEFIRADGLPIQQLPSIESFIPMEGYAYDGRRLSP